MVYEAFSMLRILDTLLKMSNVQYFISQQRNHFYQFGEIRTITIVQRQQCAFIQFATRPSAETAAEKSFNKLIINGRRLNVKWGRLVTYHHV